MIDLDAFNRLVNENNNQRRPWYFGLEDTWWWGKTEEQTREAIRNRLIKTVLDNCLELKVLWIGRNSPEKSPSTLMKIANNLQNIQFIMNIPGGSRNNLHMIGRVSDEQLEDLYNTCDAFCHTGLWPETGGPLTMLEANIHGKPVIALNRGSVQEYSCPEGRLLIDCNEDSMVAEFVKVLSKIDKNHLKELGEKSKKYVNEHFNYQKMGNNYIDLYKNFIKNKEKNKEKYDKLKILLVNDYRTMSGTEVLIKSLSKYLKETDNELKLLSTEDGNVISNFIKIIGEFGPDIVHFHNIRAIGIEPIKICNARKIPCILTLHDYYLVCRSRMYYRFDQKRECTANNWDECGNCINNTNGFPLQSEVFNVLKDMLIVCVSKYEESIIRRFGYTNTIVIYNGL